MQHQIIFVMFAKTANIEQTFVDNFAIFATTANKEKTFVEYYA